MTDIVERLRTLALDYRADDEIKEAADEIERLRNDHEAAICLARDMGESAAKLHKLLREARPAIGEGDLADRIDAALGVADRRQGGGCS